MRPAPSSRRPIVAPALALLALAGPPALGQAERVNLTSSGQQTAGFAYGPAVSADGRYVAFHSSADDLVAGDTNFSRDVFVRDRLSGVTERVSVSSGGGQGNHHSEEASISADGRYVLFSSRASNLVAGDTNGAEDVFLRDRLFGATTRISVGPAGVQGNSWSHQAQLTPDGQHAVFASFASNLVAALTPTQTGVYVRDLGTGLNTLVSVSSSGALPNNASWYPAISHDGQIVAFQSTASDLVAVDTNSHLDVFVHDRATGQTTRVSESSSGAQGNSYSQEPSISADGRYVVFESRASSLVVPPEQNSFEDVYLHDRQSGATTLVSADTLGVVGNGTSSDARISADGRFIAFHSWASNLIVGDGNLHLDIFVLDRLSGLRHRIDLDPLGGASDNHSYEPNLSLDGRFVVYESFASDLVAGDTNSASDIFIRDFLGDPACPPPGVYCSSKPSSIAGCVAELDFAGQPSASAGSGFVITAGPAPGANAGLFIYTTSGALQLPIQTPFGSLCVSSPFLRIAPQSGGGTLGTCSGQYAVDFNLFFATQTADPTLVAGAVVDLQAWFRDPPVLGGAILTQAGRFVVCP